MFGEVNYERNFERKPLPAPAWRGGFYLSNGMYCVYGRDAGGVCVDVYLTRRMEKLVAMRHGPAPAGRDVALDEARLKSVMEGMLSQFEAVARTLS